MAPKIGTTEAKKSPDEHLNGSSRQHTRGCVRGDWRADAQCAVVESYPLLQQRHAVHPSRQLTGERGLVLAWLKKTTTRWQIYRSEAGPKMAEGLGRPGIALHRRFLRSRRTLTLVRTSFWHVATMALLSKPTKQRQCGDPLPHISKSATERPIAEPDELQTKRGPTDPATCWAK